MTLVRTLAASLLTLFVVADVARADIPPPDWIDMKLRAIGKAIAALNAHDPVALGALYTEDAVCAAVGATGWHEERGRAAVVENHKKLFEFMPDVTFVRTQTYITKDTAILEWSTKGTGKDGKVRGFRAASVFTFDGSYKFKTDHTYFDADTRTALTTLPKDNWHWFVEGWMPSTLAPKLRAHLAARSARKDAEVAALFAPDAVVSSQYEAADLQGRAAVARTLADSSKKVKSLTVEPTGMWDFSGANPIPNAVAEVVVRTQLADGRTTTQHTLDVAVIKNGQIVTYTSYGNARELAPPSPTPAPAPAR